jgi:predicted lipoprotein with Yx(FWY)xxD motif
LSDHSQEDFMTALAHRPDRARRRLGGVAALFASAAIIAACSSQTGGATTGPVATNPPAAGGPIALVVATDATLGAHVTGKDGMSLYVFAKDTTPGTSACVGDCAGTWPPLTVASATDATAGSGVTGAIGTITRPDGKIQVTLAGAPLYYYSGDSAAGDTKGQGKGGVWSVASPAGTPVAGAPASTAAPSASKCSGPACY